MKAGSWSNNALMMVVSQAGTMDRPALKALLDEVDKGLIDMIVVYKIDRLTRSLSDFAVSDYWCSLNLCVQ